jgi:hypothetical protein
MLNFDQAESKKGFLASGSSVGQSSAADEIRSREAFRDLLKKVRPLNVSLMPQRSSVFVRTVAHLPRHLR